MRRSETGRKGVSRKLIYEKKHRCKVKSFSRYRVTLEQVHVVTIMYLYEQVMDKGLGKNPQKSELIH